MISITDDAIILKKGKGKQTIFYKEISYLKTKRTNSHNVLIGGLAGLSIPLVGLAQSSGDGWSSLGFILLTPIMTGIGSGIGYLTTLFKKSIHYSIQQDQVKWKDFKEKMYAPY